MTLNGHFALKSVSDSAMGWRLRLSDKTVRKFAELPIYCQRQKCSPGNVVSGSIRLMQIFAGVRWRGGVKWERGGWKWRFLLRSFTVFRTFYIAYLATRQLSGDTTVNDLGHISRSLDCFTSNFSKTVCDMAKVRKSYISFQLVPLLITLKYIWRSFQPRLSFACPFQLFGRLSRRAVSL